MENLSEWSDAGMKNADSVFKYIVLILMTLGLLFYFVYSVTKGKILNLPDVLIAIYMIVFQYFFRRAPKKEANNGNETVAKG